MVIACLNFLKLFLSLFVGKVTTELYKIQKVHKKLNYTAEKFKVPLFPLIL